LLVADDRDLPLKGVDDRLRLDETEPGRLAHDPEMTHVLS